MTKPQTPSWLRSRALPPERLRALWNLPDPPPELFAQGSDEALSVLDALPERGLAVVGTREPQERSLALVRRELGRLSGSLLVVISGLARGVDTQAHEAALAARIPTIAILGCGLGISYPPGSRELRERILRAGGLVLSEFVPRMPALPHQFLQRNRLIAGLSRAVLMVEAGHRSGALNTARWARDYDRPCFAPPCYPGDPTLAGNQRLLDLDHATPFWSIESLGSVWIDLAALPDPARSVADGSPEGCDARALLGQVLRLTALSGGAQAPELMEWALALPGWTAARFFGALETALARGWLEDRDGFLVSGSPSVPPHGRAR